MSRKNIDRTGEVHGEWAILEYLYFKDKRRWYKCLCSCGKIVNRTIRDIIGGTSKSCGCIKRKNTVGPDLIHNDESIPDSVKERFESKIFYCISGCWLWIGNKSRSGYGVLALSKNNKVRQLLAHRLSYRLYKGKISSLHVCHTCDNPLCVNPDHLFLGTPADNTRDKVIKNRQARGETFTKSKLDNLQVIAIRECRKIKIPQHEIARYFKVHQSLISYIDRGLTWKHL